MFPGLPASVARVRRYVRTATTRHGPDVADTAELLASEIATNAIVHSRSGRPGGHIAVKVDHAEQAVQIRVHDQGSANSVPQVRGNPDPITEHGHGLGLVTTLAAQWGTRQTADGGRLVWFELPVTHDPASRA
jgi:anti-sigma regulatory factor (Ser/Thr protein kinase)